MLPVVGGGLVAEVGHLGEAVAGHDADGVEDDEDDAGPHPARDHRDLAHVGARRQARCVVYRLRHGYSLWCGCIHCAPYLDALASSPRARPRHRRAEPCKLLSVPRHRERRPRADPAESLLAVEIAALGLTIEDTILSATIRHPQLWGLPARSVMTWNASSGHLCPCGPPPGHTGGEFLVMQVNWAIPSGTIVASR